MTSFKFYNLPATDFLEKRQKLTHKMPRPFNPPFNLNKFVGYGIGFLFFGLTMTNICSFMNILTLDSVVRGSYVFFCFQVLMSFTCLPFLVGIYFSAQELLPPFIIANFFAFFLTAVFIYNSLMDQDYLKFGKLHSYLVHTMWYISLIVYVVIFVLACWYWAQLFRIDAVERDKKKTMTEYPYTRFGDYFGVCWG